MSGPRRPPPLPDLASLTEAQKDELIVDLWETLQAIDTAAGGAAADPPRATSHEDLSRRIRGAPSRRRHASAPAVSRLGRSVGFLASRPLQWFVLLVASGFLIDFGIGWYQRQSLVRQGQAALALRSAAFEGMSVELARIAYEPDGTSYRGTLTMQNLNPSRPLYVLLNPARVFVQAGLAWREVPSQAPPGAGWGVVKLDGAHAYSVLFQTPLDDWSELIAGYMHVLVQSDMLVSRSSAPHDDIVERRNRFYVYLKPQGADDAAIKARNNLPGTPPIFIPMPPH